jgi:alpha-mannosidase
VSEAGQSMSVRATDRLVDVDGRLLQVVRVQPPADIDSGEVVIRGRDIVPARRTASGEDQVELPVEVRAAPGQVITAEARFRDGPWVPFELTVAEPGRELCLVPHFHVDPVFWNTQAHYTESWQLSGDPWEDGFQAPTLELLERHLRRAEEDPDYCFVASELDYLRPYWDLRPERRAVIRELIASGRLELVGGSYNQPDTNLVDPETVLRGFEYGDDFHRGTLRAEVDTLWQLDCFGHSPQLPGLAASAGLTSAVFARGPYHPWGPWWYKHADIDLPRPHTCGRTHEGMSFPADFEWLSPDGQGVTAAYLALHYHAGWWPDRASRVEDAAESYYELYLKLRQVAATRAVMILVGTDFSPPNRWVTDVARWWNARYVSPRFTCTTPRRFFRLVREPGAVSPGGARLLPQTRDMNPVMVGTQCTRAAAKLAQRHGETAVLTAESFATAASALGTPYPHHLLDQAWRRLVFCAHHDAVTGTHSEQVHVDLLGAWRQAADAAQEALDGSLDAIGSRIELPWPSIVVFNPLSWARTDVVSVELSPDLAGQPFGVRGPGGEEIAFVAEPIGAETRVSFLARDVPALGYAAYAITPDGVGAGRSQWAAQPGASAANELLSVTTDPERGGALTSLRHVASDTEFVARGEVANELVIHGQLPEHPLFEEGAWQLTPSGPVWASASGPAHVIRERSALGERLLISGVVGGIPFRQTITLWTGLARADCTATLDDLPAEALLRARFPTTLDAAAPVCDQAGSVLSRSFGWPRVDVHRAPTSHDTASHVWCGLSVTVALAREGGSQDEKSREAWPLGPAEIVVPDSFEDSGALRELVVALAAAGVSATVSPAGRPRQGCPDHDSSGPWFRIGIGRADDNEFVGALLESDTGLRARFEQRLGAAENALVWRPGPSDVEQTRADRTGDGDLPALLVAGRDPAALAAALRALAADLDDRIIEVPDDPGSGQGPAMTFAVAHRGTPGWVAERGGVLHLSLARVGTGWPLTTWIDDEDRTGPPVPGGWAQHHPQAFAYTLMAAPGDWAEVGVARAAREFERPLLARVRGPQAGPMPARSGFVDASPDTVILSSLRQRAHADGETASSEARLQELAGRSVPARLRVGWPEDISQVSHAGVTLGAFQRAAVAVGTAVAPPAREPIPATPRYSRYWLHNDGPGPAAGQAGVFTRPRSFCGPGPHQVEVVTSSRSARSARLTLPGGWTAKADDDAEVGPDWERRRYEIAPSPAARGRYFIRVSADTPAGPVEDVVVVDLPPDGQEFARPGEIELRLERERYVLRPGSSAVVTVLARNDARTQVRGELQAISPWGSWPMIPRWRQEVAIPPGATARLATTIWSRHDTPPGQWWVMLKLSYFGRCRYAGPIWVELRG